MSLHEARNSLRQFLLPTFRFLSQLSCQTEAWGHKHIIEGISPGLDNTVPCIGHPGMAGPQDMLRWLCVAGVKNLAVYSVQL